MAAELVPFLDTNILIYALTEPGEKSDRALAAIEAGGVISTQVLNEMAHVLLRKRSLDWPAVDDLLGLARRLLTVVPLTEAAHLRAMRIARETGYSIWDASIVASALEAGCPVLLTEDMQAGRRIEGLEIRNPLNG